MTPEGWRRYTIAGLLSIETPGHWGTAPSGSGEVAVLRSTNLRENEGLDFSDVAIRSFPDKKIIQKKLEPGDVLLERSGGGPNKPVGRVAYFSAKGCFSFSNFMQRLRPNTERVGGRFLAYQLSHLHASKVTLLMQQATTGIRNLNYRDYLAYELPVPPLSEQRKITAILSSVDDAIGKTQDVIEQIRVVKRGLMQGLFTRGLPGRHRRSKRTPIGEVPGAWEVKTVGAVAAPGKNSCIGGPFGSDLTRKDYVDSPGVPVIRGSNLAGTSAQLNERDFVFVSENKANALQRNMAFPGDVVVTQRGTLGQVCMIPNQSRFARYVLSQSQMKVSVDKSQISAEFLLAYLRSPRALRLIEALTVGTGVPHLNLGILKAFPVPVPAVDEQGLIVRYLSATDGRIDAELQFLRALTVLKAALMSVLLTGDLRVTPDPDPE